MFGGLHIEMTALKALGSFLLGSGWVEAITAAGIVTPGSAEALLSACHVRRTRHVHEITAAALHLLQHTAYDNYVKTLADPELMNTESTISFEHWCKRQSSQHKQFAYWSHVKEFELAILLFVRSLRQSNFDLYIDSMTKLIPWFFALDRTNYARWLPVHIRDMTKLSETNKSVYDEFMHGKFTVHKTSNLFSGISIDHAHEQLNSVLKGDGGIVGLTENDAALHRWITAGPELARLIAEFEMSTVANEGLHHEDHPGILTAFVTDVTKLVNVLEQLGNPFEEQYDLVVLHNRNIVSDDTAKQAVNVVDIGSKQYDDFVASRLSTGVTSLFAPIKRNKLAIFVKPKQPQACSKLKSKVSACRNDAVLFSRLYIACQMRNSDLDEFFRHENQVFPPALSDAGNMHFGCKSDLLSCLDVLVPPVSVRPSIDGLVIDGAVLVNMLKPNLGKTFDDYACNVVIPYIQSQLSHVQRIDIVWDRYDPKSLKGLTRVKRGLGSRQQVTPMAPIPRNWHEFLRSNDNKTDLFMFLADRLCHIEMPAGKHIVVTYDTTVLSSLPDYNTSHLSLCSHEEADTRMLLHVADLVHNGCQKVMIRTVDTDVVVLAVAFAQNIPCSELWLSFGTGKNHRYISAHELSATLGPDRACALPMFHAFTGCDTVS